MRCEQVEGLSSEYVDGRLASVAFDAAIITGKFYATLVLLAIVTSLAAGAWLERATRSEEPLR